ncbi:MAG: histone deacetylase family protein [Mesorhizobium sp.]|uniref:histone deacetylase family protein n=1 Tax=Mesorhizobium sp. TaxID=1871066 RepID=UPI000FE43E43|nr:histone deacetylase family protein [Mesorhizobium sp.]RWJ04428.1 MAG: histone deacetylase family protein [Mesorhizobium sp.]RWJ15191.1 MAG: histone deacetylase family protein [Mesorhizobium sp.]
MKVVYSEGHRSHDPQTFIHRGRLVQSPERPERADMLLSSAIDAGHEAIEAIPADASILTRVHTARYLDFLENGINEWLALPHAGPEIVPNTHPNRFASHYASHIVARSGFHQADTACPVGRGTWAAARSSVDVALNVGDLIARGERHAYGLCRPPGHHACTEMAWGFCYLNNVATLAESLRMKGAERVAILDIDIHHGNGTQQIFYERPDVLTVSVHADPDGFPVFFSGYADEIGSGAGEGFNVNLPLKHGSDDTIFVEAIAAGMQNIKDFGPDVLLIALGLDAYRGDPLSVFDVSTNGFRKAARAVSDFNGPVAMLQEGGYPCPELGDNLVAFLGAIDE